MTGKPSVPMDSDVNRPTKPLLSTVVMSAGPIQAASLQWATFSSPGRETAVVVADHWETVGTYGHLSVSARIAYAIQDGDICKAGAGRICAVGHLKVAVAVVLVAHDRETVGAYGHRGEGANPTGAVHGGEVGGAGTSRVGAVGHLKVAVAVVLVAHDRETVGAYGHRGEETNFDSLVTRAFRVGSAA